MDDIQALYILLTYFMFKAALVIPLVKQEN